VSPERKAQPIINTDEPAMASQLGNRNESDGNDDGGDDDVIIVQYSQGTHDSETSTSHGLAAASQTWDHLSPSLRHQDAQESSGKDGLRKDRISKPSTRTFSKSLNAWSDANTCSQIKFAEEDIETVPMGPNTARQCCLDSIDLYDTVTHRTF